MPVKQSAKRKVVASSSEPAYDDNKFINEEAEKLFHESRDKRSGIKERGFDISPNDFPTISAVIESRHWHKLCEQPKPAAMTVVREFYANLKISMRGRAYVRKHEVAYDKFAINRLFGLHTIDQDDYHTLSQEPPLDEIRDTICARPVEWTQQRGVRHSLPHNALIPELKVWHHFICARLMPISHLTEVSKERALLLYCIQTNRSICVGSIIVASIKHSARNTHLGLSCPSLLTALFVKAGVDVLSDEILKPKYHLNKDSIDRIMNNVGPSEEGEGSQAPQRRAARKAGTSVSEDRLQELYDRQEQHFQQFQEFRTQVLQHQQYEASCFQIFGEALSQLSLQSGVQMPPMPHPPAFHQNPYQPPPPPQPEDDFDGADL